MTFVHLLRRWSAASHTTQHHRRLTATITALVVAAAALVVAAPASTAADELIEIGTPINNVAIDKVAYGTAPNGRPVMYTTLLGSSGTTHLHVVDLRNRETIKRVVIPDGFGSRDLAVAPDGSVYIATFAQGRLYRYDPATDTLTDLGRPASGVTYLFGLSIHPDGRVFFGAYPTGHLYSYDPATEQLRDYGQLSPDSQYLRSVVVWGDDVYAGLGTQKAHFVKVDIESGQLTHIPLPDPYAAEHEVNQVSVRDDVAYVHMTASKTMLRYDLATQKWLSPIGPANGLDVSALAPNRRDVYYVSTSGTLRAFDVKTGHSRETNAFPSMFSSRGFLWVKLRARGYPGKSLVMTDYIGRLWVYNPFTKKSTVNLMDIPGEPTHIRTLGLGPDNKIWASGLGSGGLSSYDPATGELAQVPRGTVGQSDSMLSVGDELYLGTYPGASVLRYNPAEPFNWGTNPATVTNLASQGQDRPMSLASAAGRIVVGTVPNYGQLTGAIGVFDPATGSLEVDRGVAGAGSVVSLVADGDIVYASTSKWAALGIPPQPDDGKIFAYDPVSGTKLWEATPFPGLPAITEIAKSSTGTLWGLTQGKVFEFDPATQQVVRTIEIPAENWETVDHVWSEGERLAVAPDGTIYATVGGQLLRVDPDAGTYAVVTTSVSGAIFGADGNLYLSKGAVLYRLSVGT